MESQQNQDSNEIQKDELSEIDTNQNFNLELYNIRRQINLNNKINEFKCESYGMVCSIVIYQERYLFIGTSFSMILCYDLLNNNKIMEDRMHSDWVISLLILRLNGIDLLISGGGYSDQCVCVHDLTKISKQKISFTTRLHAHNKSITKIAFIENKNLLLTCGSDGQLKIWNVYATYLMYTSDQTKGSYFEEESKMQEEKEEVDNIKEINENTCETNKRDQRVNQNENNDYQNDEIRVVFSMRLRSRIVENEQIYSICESDNDYVVYGTGSGFIKVLRIKKYDQKVKQIKYFKMERSVWCLQRFVNFHFVIGYSYQLQGRVNIMNIITGENLMSIFEYSDCIHSFSILSKSTQTNIKVANKQAFRNYAKYIITIVGASKLGMVKVLNIGEQSLPKEYGYSFNQNQEWIPWCPLAITHVKQTGDNPQFQQARIFCSTGNQNAFQCNKKALPLIVYFNFTF